MPYITTEEVKAIRNNLKKALPTYKFSVTRHHGHAVMVNVMSGPLKMSEGYAQINHFWYEEHYSGNTKMLKLLNTIMKCIDAGKKSEVEVEDGDYGTVPNFYKHIAIGKWDRPYVQVK